MGGGAPAIPRGASTPAKDQYLGAHLGKKRRHFSTRLFSILVPIVKFMFRSYLMLALLLLCALGFWAGLHERPQPSSIPFDDLYENLSVLSYRDSPTDSTAR